MLCWRDRETRMTLYLYVMTYTMSIIFIHLSTITCMLQLLVHLFKLNFKQKNNINYIPWIIHQQVGTSFNSSNMSMPLRRLIYSSDHLISSLSKWLRTKDHESSFIPNKVAIARYLQLPSVLTSIMFSMES